ncbi:MAG TPA: hypothetical protein VEK39_09600 [Solirubrobacterales bacterium]|nr:hypothetical protein [Solirubrobacterales bacterium]
MSEADLWLGVLWLHLVAMAFFVGGQLVVGLAVVPVERSAPDRTRLIAIARRFGYGSLVALAVLLATGTALASHHHLWGDSTLHLKLGAVGLAIVLTLLHLRFPRAHALQAAILAVSLAIVWLGLDLSR